MNGNDVIVGVVIGFFGAAILFGFIATLTPSNNLAEMQCDRGVLVSCSPNSAGFLCECEEPVEPRIKVVKTTFNPFGGSISSDDNGSRVRFGSR